MTLAGLIEAASVALGLVYVVLAVRRSRWCWVFGGLSSAGLTWLFARSALPGQAALQAFYVAMAVYGFLRWSADGDRDGHVRVGWWPLRNHAVVCLALALLVWPVARWVAANTDAAQPLLDTATTFGSLLATWLATRARIENWLYWIVVDAALIVLSALQGLVGVALLYLAYLGFATAGFVTWLRTWRTTTTPA
jgi:nicotinamide mononucleotide transporter